MQPLDSTIPRYNVLIPPPRILIEPPRTGFPLNGPIEPPRTGFLSNDPIEPPLPTITPRETYSNAKEMDKHYARYVAGCAQARSLASVWGPRDGTGLTAVDTKRLQEELYRHIIQEVDDQLPGGGGGGSGGGGGGGILPDDTEEPTPEPLVLEQSRFDQISLMAYRARVCRRAFNDGWEIMQEVGLLNEVVSTEIEVLSMLRQIGPIAEWDKDISSPDPMLRVMLMRRYQPVTSAFASAVGAAMIANAQTRPTIRPTRFIMQQTSANAAVHFQMLIGSLHSSRKGLHDLVKHYNASVKNNTITPVHFVDYHTEGSFW